MKPAVVRALRTLAQNLVPVLGAFVMAVGKDNSFAGIKDHARVLAVALFVAFGGALTSLLSNLAEERAGVDYERGESTVATVACFLVAIAAAIWIARNI